MALLAEEIVDEWLNRQGYFTIRGIRLGVHELDLLALRPGAEGLECRHLEVQASTRPVSYVSRVPKEVQKQTGRAPSSAKERSAEELKAGVDEWIAKKFDLPRKEALRQALAPGPWTRELVVHRLRHVGELDFFKRAGITVHYLSDIVDQLRSVDFPVPAASGTPLVELMLLDESSRPEAS